MSNWFKNNLIHTDFFCMFLFLVLLGFLFLVTFIWFSYWHSIGQTCKENVNWMAWLSNILVSKKSYMYTNISWLKLLYWMLYRYIDPLPVHHWESVEVDEYKRQLQGVPDEQTFKLGWRCSLILFYGLQVYQFSIYFLFKVN